MDWFADPVPARARLFPGQAQGVPTCTVAIDAEEEFDWLRPLPGTQYSTGSMRNTEPLYDIFSAYGIVPAYLVTYPLLQDEDATRSLGRRAERGECVLGMQLHPWVTPPFDEPTAIASSFAGNLDPRIEEEKLLTLKHRFIENFGAPPRIFRAGRYGLGPATPLLLEQHGIEIDVSLAPRTSFAAEGGPDFSGYDCGLFWFGRTRRLLEIPLCRSLIGWGGAPGRWAYAHCAQPACAALASRLRWAERVTLSPEGNDTGAMRRLLRRLQARGQTIFTLSFHSTSLGIGRNPYVRTKAELHGFYDRLSATLDSMARAGFSFVNLLQVPGLLEPPQPAGR
jgi:hypothetical protein